MLQCAETLILYFFAHENKKKEPSKLGYFSNIAEVFSNAQNSPVFPDSLKLWNFVSKIVLTYFEKKMF